MENGTSGMNGALVGDAVVGAIVVGATVVGGWVTLSQLTARAVAPATQKWKHWLRKARPVAGSQMTLTMV